MPDDDAVTAGPVWQGGEAQQFLHRRWIDHDTLRRYARPDPWRWLAGTASEWAIIAATIAVCITYPYWWLWVPAILIIGSRQHALGIMAHDGTHFLVSRVRWWNDFLSNVLAAYPLMYPVQGYRTHHLEHHRWLETARDPEQAAINLYPTEWTFPMPRARWAWLLIRDSVGGSLLPGLKLARYIWQVPDGNLQQGLAIAAYHGVVVAIAAATGQLLTYLVLWVVPLFTVALMCFRVRTAAEHSAIDPTQRRYQLKEVDTMATTRTTEYGPLFKFLFGPHNMAYHIEHHLFPSVPVFRLKALHRELMRNPEYASRAHVSGNGARLFAELTAA